MQLLLAIMHYVNISNYRNILIQILMLSMAFMMSQLETATSLSLLLLSLNHMLVCAVCLYILKVTFNIFMIM